MEIDNRPRKKRRFFVDDDAEGTEQEQQPASSSINNSPDPVFISFPEDHQSSQSDAGDIEYETEPQPERQLEHRSEQQPAQGSVETSVSTSEFDVDTFCAFIGEQVDRDVVQKIQDVANGNMERAINMYLDGSWKSVSSRANGVVSTAAQSGGMGQWLSTAASRPAPRPESSPRESGLQEKARKAQVRLRAMPSERYIGSFGAAGWTTKSGSNLLRPGESVRIERSKIAPKTKVGRGGKLMPAVGRNQKADVITRFTNARGEEIGRLPEETAKWVSSLLDQKICRFEGSCVYAPDRVRVNDTVYLQLRAYMLKSACEASAFVIPSAENREVGLFTEKESTEEKDLRLRQVSLVKLFDEINLQPSRTNSTTAKHKKQGLLRAAEMAEQYENKPKSNDSSAQGSDAEDGQELEEGHLDELYRKAQQFDFDTPEHEPADTFALDLRKYQKQALHWMLNKERDARSENKQMSMHPLWDEYIWPTKDANDEPVAIVDDQDKFYVNLYSGEINLEFPVQEQNCLGGILADEMGLGKTIEMFSLIHSHKSDEAVSVSDRGLNSVNNLPRLPQSSSLVEPAPHTTLVVAPMSLLAQWESEAIKCSKPGSMKTLVYYGSERGAGLQTLCSTSNPNPPNVVITSYGVVLSEFNQIANRGGDRAGHGGLFSLDFFRVILDEAHNIKNRQAKTSKACYELKAKHRWVLTGTPIVNRLEDLFSLVRFLHVEPWNNFSFWKTFITVPFESKDFVRALNVVQTVLEPLVLRRTKDMKTPDGEALVPLPPRTIVIEEVELSKTEREVYDLIFTRAKRAFNESVAAGTLLKSYTTIFAQILRLRQSCCHPVLTRNKAIVADEEEAAAMAAASDVNGFADDMDLQDLINRFTDDTNLAEKEAKDNEATNDATTSFPAHALRQIQDDAGGECPICAEEPMITPAVTTCWHSACRSCLEDYISHQTEKNEVPRCHSCREPIDPRDVFEIVKYDTTNSHPSKFKSSNIFTRSRRTRTEHNSSRQPPSPLPEVGSSQTEEDGGDDDDDDSEHDDTDNNDSNSNSEDDDTYGSKPAPLSAHPPASSFPLTEKISLRRVNPHSPSASTSAKIARLLSHISSQPAGTKSVIFSQFTSFLDLISPQLSARGLAHLRFDGTMSQKLRAAVLREFCAENAGDPSAPRILLLSLRAGGVGLNLTAANFCYVMDPWWSFAVEAQAIDRVHRMGQTREVRVVRFVVKDSIEGRMLKVQERKMAVAGTLGVGHSGGSGGGASIEDLETLLG